MRTSPKVPIKDPGGVQKLLRRWHLGDDHIRQSAPDWETPYTWLPELRTWSPAVAPPILGLILVFIATLSAPVSQAGRSTASTSDSLPLLFLLYFVCGILYGLCLYLAPSLSSWAKVLVGGALLYGLAALWFLGGLPLLLFGLILCGGLGLYYLRTCWHFIPADTLHITTLAGHYWRAIPSGRALLLPGERLRLELPNPARQYTTPLVQVHLCDAAGNRFITHATATASYCYSPVDALSKRVMPEKWEDDLQKTIRETLRDMLAIFGHGGLESYQTGQMTSRRDKQGGPIEGQELAQALLDRLRRQAVTQGLAIGWVRIRDLRLAPDPRFTSSESVIYTPVVLPPLGLKEKNSPAVGAMSPVESADLEDLPVEALLDLYDTVRVNYINDPETIRSIAEAFRVLGYDKDRSGSCPYDTEEVAELLFQYAASLEQ